MGFSIQRTLVRAAAFATLLQITIAAPSYSQSSSAGKLPVVDLGYELQQATLLNSTGGYYNFSNIRYAAPPTGENRFRVPQPPATNRSTIQTGLPDRICAQATPLWELEIALEFIPEYLAGQTVFNQSSFNTSAGLSALPPQDPRTTEDCLFLDVLVPQKIFDSAGSGSGAPVLVWIYGGGYTAGSKSDSGNPAGLILESESNGKEGVIYVSLNYRLGAFGWLAGPTFQEDGTANVGLYDQRFALEWVQEHISKFGGDPSRVTVLGESAGGGSIMHQITAYGGTKPVPFQQAIPQSPGWFPQVSNNLLENQFNHYLSLLGVSTIEEARQLPYETLVKANTKQVARANYGQFVFGPAVDGSFVPALPGELLLHGQFAKDVKVMVGHNADEGLLFTSPFNQNNKDVRNSLLVSIPTLAGLPKVTNYILQTLYPPIFDGSQAMGYTNEIARSAAIISDLIFVCNTFYLDKAYSNNTYAYQFSVPPATHGSDIAYTYYNGPNAFQVSSPQIAIDLQKYITNFVETGTPNGPGVPNFPIYGSSATAQDLNATGITQITDPAANQRCDWWQKALYF